MRYLYVELFTSYKERKKPFYTIRAMPQTTETEQQKEWFVLRVTYQRELSAKAKLDALGIACFVPTKVVRKLEKSGKYVKKRVSALHNYIFVNSTRSCIDNIKLSKIPWLRYVIDHKRDNTKSTVLTVPEKQMLDFIAVAGSDDEHIEYISEEEINFSRGERVRILGGPFEGVEGIFMKINNKRGRCVVVKIEGITAVATTTIPSILVEKIEQQ